MKFSINNRIFDTENIFSIGEIIGEYYSTEIYFTIVFFDDKTYNVYCDTLYYSLEGFEDIVDYEELNGINKEHFDEACVKLEEVRNGIYKLWSNNQSQLPSFSIK